MKNREAIGAVILLIGLTRALMASEATSRDPALKFVTEKSTQVITRTELAARLTPAEITVYSPVYQRPMTYEGFWLDQVFQAFHLRPAEQDIVFESADGYETSLPVGDIGKEKWLVAYGEPEGWTPLPERHERTTPGPWYVVGREPSSYQDFPWPYQVIAIKIQGQEF